jgi:cystathionine beta-lyase
MTDLSTRLIHHPYRPPEGFDAPQAAVHKASTIFFPSVAEMRARYHSGKAEYTYGLHGTPTSFLLQQRLCELEGGDQCLLLPSGLGAITTVDMALLRTGDELLVPDNVYGPARAFAEGELLAFGITHRLYDANDLDDLAAKLSPRTRLVWAEAPGSITMEFPDLAGIVRLCRAAGVICALDNTWGAGLAFKPFDLGDGLAVDISVQALTKYPSGGGDVLMGSIVTRDAALHRRLMLTRRRLGTGVGMNDVEAVLRSLPSIDLRYRAHDLAARELARWCSGRDEIVQVLHPALPDSPGHRHWQALCSGGRAAGLFSVILHERFSPAQVDAFCDALRLFKIGYSWGGPVSLVVPYEMDSMRDNWPAHLRRGSIVRFSIGLEHVDDLRDDLAQAMDARAFRGAN